MRKIAFAIVLSIAFTQPVLARSCSQQAALCADWARKNAPTLERACMVVDLDELLKLAPMEERIYRLRCVEGWSMVLPWVGYSLAELVRRVEPTGNAKYIEFVTPYMQEFLAVVRNCDFFISDKEEAVELGYDPAGLRTGVMIPLELKGRDIVIGGSTYRVGIGGLHSQESSVAHRTIPGVQQLRTADVASYYPSLIINAGMNPTQLGPLFLDIYKAAYTERLAAKRDAKKYPLGSTEQIELATIEGGFKIVLNGTFGKLFSNASITDLWGSVIKCTLFGAMIAVVCCYKGMTASGGAAGVGRAVNEAVVISFMAVFAFNYVFTQTLLATNPELQTIR